MLLVACRGRKPNTEWQEALAKLPPETQGRLQDFNLRATIFVFQHVIYASFFRYLVLRPLAPIFNVRVVIKSERIKSSVERLETATLEEDEASELVAV
jgi:hypothetical protein